MGRLEEDAVAGEESLLVLLICLALEALAIRCFKEALEALG